MSDFAVVNDIPLGASWMRTISILALSIFSFAFVAACSSLEEPKGATRFDPPAKYRTLWKTVESCSGASGTFDDVSWFVTDGSAGGDREGVAGSWWPNNNRIYLNDQYLDSDELVRHEMLHALLRGLHHELAFAYSCGGIVTCVAECLHDTGFSDVTPSPLSPVIQPGALAVRATVIPAQALDDGWSTVVIEATNPNAYSVWVDLSGRAGIEFECFIGAQHCGTHFTFSADHRAEFGPNESRREATVFRLLPGSFQVTAAFNTNSLAPIGLVVPTLP